MSTPGRKSCEPCAGLNASLTTRGNSLSATEGFSPYIETVPFSTTTRATGDKLPMHPDSHRAAVCLMTTKNDRSPIRTTGHARYVREKVTIPHSLPGMDGKRFLVHEEPESRIQGA